MYILSINAYHGDSSACILKDETLDQPIWKRND